MAEPTKPQPPLYEQFLIRESLAWATFRRLLGLICFALMLVAMFVCLAVFGTGARTPKPEEAPYVFAIGFAALVAWPLLGTLGMRLTSQSGITMLRWSRKRPIVYLRSFAADAAWFDSPLDLFWLIVHGARYETYEWSLAKAVRSVGPLIAIGEPGERLPPLGAARIYVDGDNWQMVVEELVERSQLVILRAGRTPGFWWELEHLAKSCDPRKVVIYLPKRDRAGLYQHLREKSAGILPQPLPEGTAAAIFLGFGPGWEPRLLQPWGPTLGATFRRLLIGSPAPEIRAALNDALEPLGIRRRGLPLQFREWVLVACALTIVLTPFVVALIIAILHQWD
jgi:hypothetical protein